VGLHAHLDAFEIAMNSIQVLKDSGLTSLNVSSRKCNDKG